MEHSRLSPFVELLSFIYFCIKQFDAVKHDKHELRVLRLQMKTLSILFFCHGYKSCSGKWLHYFGGCPLIIFFFQFS